MCFYLMRNVVTFNYVLSVKGFYPISEIPSYITQSYGICVECLCKRILEFMSTSKVPHIKNYKCLFIHT